MFITVENLKKSYQAGENKNEVLGGIPRYRGAVRIWQVDADEHHRRR